MVNILYKGFCITDISPSQKRILLITVNVKGRKTLSAIPVIGEGRKLNKHFRKFQNYLSILPTSLTFQQNKDHKTKPVSKPLAPLPQPQSQLTPKALLNLIEVKLLEFAVNKLSFCCCASLLIHSFVCINSVKKKSFK